MQSFVKTHTNYDIYPGFRANNKLKALRKRKVKK